MEQNKDIHTGKKDSLQVLINGLKSEDQKYLKITKNFQIIFWVMIALYTLLFIANPDKELSLTYRLSGISYILAFIIFLLLFKNYYKELKSVDYSVPTAVMLKHTIKRFKLFQPRTALAIIPVALIDLGVTISLTERLEQFSMIHKILTIQAFYIPLMLISFGIGVLIWYKKQKPLRDKAIMLLNEIEA